MFGYELILFFLDIKGELHGIEIVVKYSLSALFTNKAKGNKLKGYIVA